MAAMAIAALLFVCLACMGMGRRVQVASWKLQSHRDEESPRAMSHLQPAAAFNPFGMAGSLPGDIPKIIGSSPTTLDRQHRVDYHNLAMQREPRGPRRRPGDVVEQESKPDSQKRTKKVTRDAESERFAKLTLQEMRERCRAANISDRGNKPTLVKRIQDWEIQEIVGAEHEMTPEDIATSLTKVSPRKRKLTGRDGSDLPKSLLSDPELEPDEPEEIDLGELSEEELERHWEQQDGEITYLKEKANRIAHEILHLRPTPNQPFDVAGLVRPIEMNRDFLIESKNGTGLFLILATIKFYQDWEICMQVLETVETLMHEFKDEDDMFALFLKEEEEGEAEKMQQVEEALSRTKNYDDELDIHEEWILKIKKIDTIHYNVVIAACAQAGKWREALDLLKRMEEMSVRANTVTYNSILHALDVKGRSNIALRIFEKMRQEGIDQDEKTYASVLSALAHAGQSQQAVEFLEHAYENGQAQDRYFYANAIKACERSGDWELAMNLLQKMLQNNFQPDVRVLSSLLAVCAKAGQVEVCERIFRDTFMVHNVVPDLICYNTFLAVLARASDGPQIDRMREVMREMETIAHEDDMSMMPDVSSYNNLIQAYANANKSEEALKVLWEEMPSKNIPPDFVSYTSAAVACNATGDWERAIELIENAEENSVELDSYAFAPAITATTNAGQWSEACKLLDRMSELELPQNPRYVNIVLVSCIAAGDITAAGTGMATLQRVLESDSRIVAQRFVPPPVDRQTVALAEMIADAAGSSGDEAALFIRSVRHATELRDPNKYVSKMTTFRTPEVQEQPVFQARPRRNTFSRGGRGRYQPQDETSSRYTGFESQPTEVKSVAEGQELSGVITEVGDKFAFIECEIVKNQYGRDVYCPAPRVASAGLDVGSQVDFEFRVNTRGQPQAHNIRHRTADSGHGIQSDGVALETMQEEVGQESKQEEVGQERIQEEAGPESKQERTRPAWKKIARRTHLSTV